MASALEGVRVVDVSQVAAVPMAARHLADFGADMPEALERLQAMLAFHLDCLREEGKPIPAEGDDQEGFFLRVHAPAHAA